MEAAPVKSSQLVLFSLKQRNWVQGRNSTGYPEVK